MTGTARSQKVDVLGCRIDALTLGETLAEVERIVETGVPVQHCVVNASKAVLMQSDARLRDIVTSCALVNADGQSVVWAARILGRPLPERVAGIDLFQALLARAAMRGWGVYFLGATYDVVAESVARAHRDHPDLKVCGWHDGYLREGDTDAIVAEVNETRPHILFVGMPSPRKEYWLAENLERMAVPFCMGVGGSFDVYSGRTKRAPLWMQKAGLEWFHRFAAEPRRMWRRYLFGNLSFAWLVGSHYRNERGQGRRRTDVEAGTRTSSGRHHLAAESPDSRPMVRSRPNVGGERLQADES